MIIVAVLAVLYYHARRKLSRYQEIHDEGLVPICRVRLEHFQLMSCNAAFASLLGYSNPAECISLFGEYAHLRGQGFDDVCSKARGLKQEVVAIEMVNRSGEMVASEAEILVVDGADFMEVRLRTG
ncbi:MAG: hypothetical protein HUJ31_07420, partial [Pseudomonadales bacterium]|nr:hypothetical protein [Pseudomonadales bacterium]